MGWQDYAPRDLRLQYRTDLTPGMEERMAEYAAWSEQVVSRIEGRLDIPYGQAGPRQSLDVFAPASKNAPVVMFFHGGFWYFNSKEPRRFPAELFTLNAIAWAPVNYRLAPAATMDEIVADVRKSVAWMHEHARECGCDPERIYVCGNSAGGHLTAELISDDWPETFGLPGNVVKGACAVSGVFDLEPLIQCEPNEKVKLDHETALRNSPIHHPSTNALPVIVACGGEESDEFKRQSAEYAQLCRVVGHRVTHFELPGHDHFSIIGEFANPDGRLFKEILAMIRE